MGWKRSGRSHVEGTFGRVSLATQDQIRPRINGLRRVVRVRVDRCARPGKSGFQLLFYESIEQPLHSFHAMLKQKTVQMSL